MMTIMFGDVPEAILNIDSYFDNTYESSWFEDEVVKQMVRDIDHSEVLGNGAIDSPYLGVIAPSALSGGVKTLISLYKGEQGVIHDLVTCGENCEDWILKISELRDIWVSLSGAVFSFKDKPIKALCLNDNSQIGDYHEWIKKMVRYCHEEVPEGVYTW